MRVVELSHGRGLLPAPAAASLHRLDADLGHPVQVTEAGRTWERQHYLWVNRYQPGFNPAWHPDDPRANHVLTEGREGAIDSDEQTGVPWEDHGWILTVPWEPWHREYQAGRDNHRFDQIINGGNGHNMEAIILRDDGTVFHITPVQAYAFKDVDDYNAYRDIVRATGIATNLLRPPRIGKLKKWPAWRVKALADRMGVTLPK